MDEQHQIMRNRLNEVVQMGGVTKRDRSQIQGVIEQARQTTYRALVGQQNPGCKIPTGFDGSGQLQYCSSPATQACHGIQATLLETISDPGTSAGCRSNLEVLEIFPKDPEYWQRLALRYDFLWNVDRIRPNRVRARGASTRPFACNPHDSSTFEAIESPGLSLPPDREAISFSEWDEQKPDSLGHHLFLMAYRSLLFHHDLLGSLRSSLSIPVQERNPIRSRVRAQIQQAQIPNVARAHDAVALQKSEYDARLLGSCGLPLTHHLIPLVTAASATFSDYIVEDVGGGVFEHAAVTLWPEHVGRREHRLLISHPVSIGGHMASIVERATEDALASQSDHLAMVNWLVNSLRRSRNAYVRPSEYDGLPDWAKCRIEESLVEVVIENSMGWVEELLKISRKMDQVNLVRSNWARRR